MSSDSPLVEHVRQQAAACRALGSAFYGELLDLVADDVAANGPLGAVLQDFESAPGPAGVALRLTGTAHRLALDGSAPQLARHFPSTGGDGNAKAAYEALSDVARARREALRSGLDRAPQTNETGRAAALLGALLHVIDGELPVRLWEIGSSGGLNLLADRFRYVGADGRAWGPGTSPVTLAPAWDALPDGLPGSVTVIERVGGDVAPVDPTADPLRLEAYVWPDQPARLERLRGAVALARETPVRRIEASAADLLADLELQDGAVTVVWHSVMWQYMPRDEQERVRTRLDELGAGASEDAPFIHIAFEPRRLAPGQPHRFIVSACRWPGGEERVLGEAPPHGVPVRWGAPGTTDD